MNLTGNSLDRLSAVDLEEELRCSQGRESGLHVKPEPDSEQLHLGLETKCLPSSHL